MSDEDKKSQAEIACESNADRISALEKKVSEMKEWENYLSKGGLLEQIMEQITELKKITNSQVVINNFYQKAINELRKDFYSHANLIVELKEELVNFENDFLIGQQDEINKIPNIESILRELIAVVESEFMVETGLLEKLDPKDSGGDDKPVDSTHILVQCPKCNHRWYINKEEIL